MVLKVPDNLLETAGISEREARVELACRLFHIGRLDLWPAAQLAGLTRVDFEDELSRRGIPIFRPTIADLQDDLNTLKGLRPPSSVNAES